MNLLGWIEQRSCDNNTERLNKCLNINLYKIFYKSHENVNLWGRTMWKFLKRNFILFVTSLRMAFP